jgi:hypothetical protein
MLGMAPAPAQAETQEETPTMDVTETTSAPVAETPAVDVAGLQAALASKTAELAEAQAKIAELTADVAAAVEFNAAREKAAAEAKAAARKEKIVAAVGTDKAASLLAATEKMEDGAFDAVMAALTTTQTVEAKTDLFKEVGVDAEADTSTLTTSAGRVMDYLTAKYKPAKAE